VQDVRIVVVAELLAPGLHFADPVFDPADQRALIDPQFDDRVELKSP
jgi:hypothetical protein